MPQQLLMIEDDTRLATMVGEYLRQSGYGFRMHGHRVMRALHSDHNAVLVTMGPRG